MSSTKSIFILLSLMIFTYCGIINLRESYENDEWRNYQYPEFWTRYKWIGQKSLFCRNKCQSGSICVIKIGKLRITTVC
jgi:hypothetical protein